MLDNCFLFFHSINMWSESESPHNYKTESKGVTYFELIFLARLLVVVSIGRYATVKT